MLYRGQRWNYCDNRAAKYCITVLIYPLSSSPLLGKISDPDPEDSMAVVKLTTFSVEDENQNTITKWRCCSIEVSHYVPGTGRFSTGKMSPAETLRRISLREGQNTKPSLVSSFSESRHQYEESVGVYKAATKIFKMLCTLHCAIFVFN